MIVFPHAKINLGLHITGKENKPGGYHTIETVLFPVNMFDALEVIPAPDHSMRFSQSGLPLPDDGRNNLCLNALSLISEELRNRTTDAGNSGLPPLHIHLHKKIPAGAGLGGGSSDASHMLLLLNKRFGLNLAPETLSRLAAKLGSDCPFFLQRQPMLATGRGDQLHPMPELNLQGYTLIIVCPPVHISTAAAYRLVSPARPAADLKQIVHRPVEEWQGKLVNDFEAPISRHYPEVAEAKKHLMASGAVYASLSGSGSAVYGLFSSPPSLDELQTAFPSGHIVKAAAGIS